MARPHVGKPLIVMDTRVIPDGAKRKSGIHSGAFPISVPEWIPGLPAVARDDPRIHDMVIWSHMGVLA